MEAKNPDLSVNSPILKEYYHRLGGPDILSGFQMFSYIFGRYFDHGKKCPKTSIKCQVAKIPHKWPNLATLLTRWSWRSETAEMEFSRARCFPTRCKVEAWK